MDTDCKQYILGNTAIRYIVEPETMHVMLQLIPVDRLDLLVKRRDMLDIKELKAWGKKARAWNIGSLVHLHLRHHPQPIGQGMTLRGSLSTENLRYESQQLTEEKEQTVIRTSLLANEGYRVVHTLCWKKGENAFTVQVMFENISDRIFTLEMLSSFSLDNLSPFQKKSGSGKLRVHRFRSAWSLEGRHDVESIERLQLERSWFGCFPECERFGMTGSWAVKRFFPFVALEDTDANVFWGVQLSCHGSWQMEIGRENDCITLAGGLADYELGHWSKDIAPGESFHTPIATIATVHGDLDDLCYSLTHLQHRAADEQPAIEADMPIVFNDWCSNWGKPGHDSILRYAELLQNTPTRYLVMDAGWTGKKDEKSLDYNDDWIPSPRAFPYGIKETARRLREMGFIPGIWFEFEVTTPNDHGYSDAYRDMHLTRNGHVITISGTRSFWDFRNPKTIAYLDEKVIRFLKENEFGYLKVDYNATIGFGCDGAESLGEGLRQHLDAVKDFFTRIRKEIPDIIIENCASGGHRLEPGMIGLTAMSSFSDAHECDEIPYIAASLHMLMLPRQMQIWSVLRKSDTEERLYYSLCAAFLGRMCLSGDLLQLNRKQWTICEEAQKLYKRVALVIKHGFSRIHREIGESMHKPTGRQAVVRLSEDGKCLLVVAHAFANPPQDFFVIDLPKNTQWSIDAVLNPGIKATVQKDTLLLAPIKDFSATVVFLSINNTGG